MDDLERLSWVIDEVEKLTANGHIDALTEENVEVLWVSMSLLNTAVTQSKGIRTLIAADLFDAAGPLERALWELWNDFNYLFKHGDRRINSQKVLINATFEMLSFFDSDNDRHAEHRATLEASLRDYEHDWPVAFGEVREQRRKRRYHWSGLSRSAIERILAPGSTTYKALSWEAHAVLAPLKGIDINVADDFATMRFDRYQDAFADPVRLAWSTGAVLYYMWNAFAKQWGLALLEPPDATSPMAEARSRLIRLVGRRIARSARRLRST